MTYPNAPIVEAVLDVQISDTVIINPLVFEEFAKRELIGYPNSNKIFNIQLQISDIQKNEEFNKTKNLLGYIFSNIQNNRKVQFRLDGYSYNMLRPYSNWDDFSENALSNLKKYIDFVKPKSITRIGLRYINRIDLPLEENEFEKYIKYLPPIPSDLPKKYKNLFWRMEVPSNDSISKAIITQTFESIKENSASFIIDIDVYQDEKIDTSESLTERFNSLRELKNQIFEDLITDNCKTLFK